MTYTSLFKISILGCLCLLAVSADAATMRTTAVESINSIRLESATSSVITGQNGSPVGFFALTFSIEAFETPLAIPVRTMRSGVVTVKSPLGYTFLGRQGNPITTGFAAAVLVSADSTSTTSYTIPKNERRSFTLFAVHADAAGNREDERLRITALPLALPDAIKPIHLNPSELQELETGFALLSE